MFIKSINIKGFKSYSKDQKIEFAIPDGSNIGSGLTIITGQNNSGKTTIFEAIKKFGKDQYVFEEEKNTAKFSVTIRTDDNKKITATTVEKESANLQYEGETSINVNNLICIPSRRHRNASYSGSAPFGNYNTRSFRREKNQIDSDFGSLLDHIDKDKSKKSDFNAVLTQIMPKINNWTITRSKHGTSVIYVSKNGTKHPIDASGDGLISVFQIAARISETNTDKILFIDEPELSLQPEICRRLINFLAKESQNRQIIISTHSPYFIRRNDICNGAEIYRLFKENDRNTIIYKINKTNEYFKKIIKKQNRQTPHMMDEIAKEVFFVDKVLFTEGQEDVALLSKFISENNIEINFNIFGYGVGGASNIKRYLGLAKDLGIKAGVLLDGDRKKQKKDLEREFDNEYKIECISKNDIRDKHPQYIIKTKTDKHKKGYLVKGRLKELSSSTPYIEGLFTTKGKIKNDGSKEEMTGLVNDFNEYFLKE